MNKYFRENTDIKAIFFNGFQWSSASRGKQLIFAIHTLSIRLHNKFYGCENDNKQMQNLKN